MIKNFLRLGAFLQREGDRILRPYKITQQQFVVLKQIEERGLISQKEICSELLFEKSNVSKISSRLQKLNLVRSLDLPQDGRVMLLRPTDKGLELISSCMERLNQWNAHWLAHLSDKELRQCAHILNQLKSIRR